MTEATLIKERQEAKPFTTSELLAVMASRLMKNGQIRRAPDQTKIPFFTVEAVVEVPFGSAPHECYGVYEPFFKHLDAYALAMRKDAEKAIAAYLERYFYGPKDWAEYLSLLGVEEMLDASRRGRRIYDD